MIMASLHFLFADSF